MASDRPTIRLLALDLMDTLIVDPYREALVATTGRALEELAPFRNEESWHDFELGRIDERTYAERFLPPAAGPFDIERYKRELNRRYAWVPGMERLALRAATRVPIHVLSNYPVWYEELRGRFLLDRFVSGHHPSYLLRARKPAPAFFRHALRRIGVEASAVLFVDDRDANVGAAREVGMRAVKFEGADELDETLRRLI
ncbi:MAG: HAD-IA family hydrolase [Acidobacteria bacterium]|nr:HAD-IA family hydrolase [Acidobacteriota bacterium]